MPIIRVNGMSVLFVHIPKTGGNAITAFLRNFGDVTGDKRVPTHSRDFFPTHMHAATIEGLFPANFFDYTFMVVRHPVDRMVSEYRYRVKIRPGRSQFTPSFSLWLRYALWRAKRDPGFHDGHMRPQTAFEVPGCEVFRYEDGLDKVASRLNALFGGQASLDKKNEGQRIKVRVTDKDRARIMQFYRQDFERYGYDLASPQLANEKG